MIRKATQLTVSTTEDGRVHVLAGKRRYDLSLDQALSYAYWLIKDAQYQAAAAICEPASRFGIHAQRAAIFLAQCAAGRKDYAACSEVLRSAFTGRDEPIAEDLQAAFVYHNLGMHQDAIRGLAALAKDHPELPTLYLLLGDWFSRLGYRDRAALCWKSAVRQDRRDGSAARAALDELGRLEKAG